MFMRRTVVIALAIALLPAGATAGPILESAQRAAARIAGEQLSFSVSSGQQPQGCAAANVAGQEAADAREGSTGWLVGGMFIPVVMPVAAMLSNPAPPAALIMNQADEDVACFQDGYRQRARGKKTKAAWIGSGVGIGLFFVAVASAASSVDY